MLLRAGRHALRRPGNPDTPFLLEYATACADRPSRLRVWVNDRLIEDAWIGPYSPHTWWSGNPLITVAQAPEPGDIVVIEVTEGAVLRIESNLEIVPNTETGAGP
ncbi:MAG: hypothetical protein ACREWG_00615 [Gammaproteobacteria bacterium]